MKNIYNYIVKSSADPRATSISIKFALLAVIPYLMQALELVCQFGYQCYNVDPPLLETIVDALSNGIFYSLGLISFFGTIGGLLRKVKRSIQGNNLSLLQVD